jgi:hypothetical protein
LSDEGTEIIEATAGWGCVEWQSGSFAAAVHRWAAVLFED